MTAENRSKATILLGIILMNIAFIISCNSLT